MELGIAVDGRNPIPRLIEQARAAEAAGAVSFWVSSHLFQRDPFSMAAAVLGATTRLRVALMAVSPYAVHPVHIAMAAATLDEIAPGRVVLSLGSGAPVDLDNAGIEPRRRRRTLREALELARLLLAGERVQYPGEVFRVQGRGLDGGGHAIPLFLAASGAQTLELAGARADGVVLSTASSVEFVRWALDQVARGAEGRPRRRAGLVYAASTRAEAAALGRFRRSLAVILQGGHHAENVRLAGLSLDQAALRRAVASQDWRRVEALITDDIVRAHTASGTTEQMRQRLAAYHAAGLDEIVLAGLYDPEETAATLRAAAGAPS